MNFSDILKIVNKKITTKSSCLFIIFSFLTFVVLYSCLTIINISSDYKKTVSNSYLGRTYVIDSLNDEQIDVLNKQKEVEILSSIRYLNSKSVNTPTFINKGVINLKPLLNENDIKINKGRNIRNNNEIVCPTFFYPYDLYIFDNSNVQKKYNRKLVVNDIVNYKKIILENDDGKEYTFDIVGAYNNNPLEEINTCYVTKNDFEKFKDNIDYCSENDNGDEECFEYSSYFVRVKSNNKIDNLKKIFEYNNISFSQYFVFDEAILNNLTQLPIFISFSLIIITVIILSFWLKKKNINNQTSIALYKALGFSNKDIRNINLFELLVLFFISISIASFVYFIIYTIFSNIYLIDFIYNNYYIKIPLVEIIIVTFIIILYAVIVDYILLKHKLKSSVNILYNEGE